MKKYKLKKWYPSLLKEMKVGDEVLFDGKFYTMRIGNSNTNIGLSRGEVENNPEFWEGVKNEDYEILSLSFKRSERPEIRSVQGYGDDYIEALLKCDNTIYSIKRLSDAEIFSIGDKITVLGSDMDLEKINKIETNKRGTPCLFTDSFSNHGLNFMKVTKVKEPEKLCVPIGTKFKIDLISSICTINRVEQSRVWINCGEDMNGFYYEISSLNKLFANGTWKEVKPLLITEDGVELFECNSYTTVNSNFSIFSGYTVPKDFKLKKDIKYFSSWELASNYVEENKPRFSKKQLREEFNEYSDYCFPINNLKEKFELL